MRSKYLVLIALAASVLSGCLSHRKPPYSSDPLLLHYKPTLNDSATILAEQQARRGPTKPPMPLSSREGTLEAKATPRPPLDLIQPVKAETRDPLPPPSFGPTSATPLPPPDATPLAPPAPELPSRPTEFAVAPHQPADLPPPVDELKPSATPKSSPMDMVVKIPAEPMNVANPEPIKRGDFTGDYGHDADYTRLQGVLERHYRGYFCVRYCDPSVEDEHGGKVRLEDDQRLAEFGEGDVIAVEGEILAPQQRDGRGITSRFRIREVRIVHKK